jgi:glycosyltransferase involved in cell wall biosynthesis
VGRIEESKGVFLILSMAEALERNLPGQLTWRIFGYGGATAELARRVEQRKLGHLIEIAGRLTRETVQEAYGWAHAALVPTTSQFNEGLAMTAVEAVLAGRPVVVSTVVPAWEVLGDAAIRASADDVDSFVTIFRRLVEDSGYYERCRQATMAVQEQFYDVSRGLGAVLGEAISTVLRRTQDSL